MYKPLHSIAGADRGRGEQGTMTASSLVEVTPRRGGRERRPGRRRTEAAKAMHATSTFPCMWRATQETGYWQAQMRMPGYIMHISSAKGMTGTWRRAGLGGMGWKTNWDVGCITNREESEALRGFSSRSGNESRRPQSPGVRFCKNSVSPRGSELMVNYLLNW